MTADVAVDEATLARDRVRVMGYFAGRAGMWCTIAEIVAGAGVPADRAFQALDVLVEHGYLSKDNEVRLPARPGRTVPAWVRRS